MQTFGPFRRSTAALEGPRQAEKARPIATGLFFPDGLEVDLITDAAAAESKAETAARQASHFRLFPT